MASIKLQTARLIAVISTLLTAPALAQSPSDQPGFFKPPADDTSIGFLREIFGAVVDTIMSGQTSDQAADTALAAGFQVFGMGVLALGMLFVIYTTIKGAVDTAHDGEFLGKKLSSVWVPLRTAVGTAFLLPLKSGFSLVQIAVLWVGIHGVGLADRVWVAMADYMGQTGMIGRPNIPDSRSLASNILRFEVCSAAMNKQYIAEQRPDRVAAAKKTEYVTNTGEIASSWNMLNYAINPIAAAANTIEARYEVVSYSWNATGGYINNEGICGSLNWEESEQSAESNGSRTVHKATILAAQGRAVEAMIQALHPVAAQIVAGQKPAPGALENAANAYENTLRAAASQAVDAANNGRESDFVEHAKEGGWIFAGAYYNQIIMLNDAVQSAVNALPQSAAATIDDKEARETLITYQDALTTANEYIRNSSQSPKRAYESAVDADVKLPKSWDDMKRLINRPALGAINQMTQEIAGANTSHIAQMKSVGDIVVATAWTVAGIHAIASGFGGGLADDILTVGTFDAGSALQSIDGLIWFMVVALLSAGMFLSFYVSMIPYIVWTTGLIKWLTVVVESVIAAPIWAAAHIHPDGDDQVGRAGPGYMIILSLFMRPTLMVFGLALSIIMAQPVAHFVNLTYITQVQGAMGNSANFLGAMIAYTVIYALIMAIVLHAVFSLINYIPDQVLRWVGSAVGAHGIADQEAHEVQNRALGVFSRTSQAAAPGERKPRPPKPGTTSSGRPTDGDKSPSGAGNDAHSTSDSTA